MGKTFRQKIKCIIKQTQCCSIVGLCRDRRRAVNMFIVISRCCLQTYLELFLQSSKLLKIVNSKFLRKWVISFLKECVTIVGISRYTLLSFLDKIYMYNMFIQSILRIAYNFISYITHQMFKRNNVRQKVYFDFMFLFCI